MLVLAAAEACGTRVGLSPEDSGRLAMPAACAIELIHTYSLIHDDLPSMDNDTMRRGRPTSHVVHGEAMAILAGDGLLTEAFALLARDHDADTSESCGARPANTPGGPHRRGSCGFCWNGRRPGARSGGRVEPGHAVRPENLRAMHARKTGALIRGSAVAGAVMAGADEAMTSAVDAYGESIGLAFQIVDDILDVEGESADARQDSRQGCGCREAHLSVDLRPRRIAAVGALRAWSARSNRSSAPASAVSWLRSHAGLSPAY